MFMFMDSFDYLIWKPNQLLLSRIWFTATENLFIPLNSIKTISYINLILQAFISVYGIQLQNKSIRYIDERNNIIREKKTWKTLDQFPSLYYIVMTRSFFSFFSNRHTSQFSHLGERFSWIFPIFRAQTHTKPRLQSGKLPRRRNRSYLGMNN